MIEAGLFYEPAFLNFRVMPADFTIQIRVDRKTGTYALRLTDASTFTVDALIGLFKVTYPNGTVEQNTDGSNPDISVEGGSVDYPLYFDSDNAVLRGEYTVLYTVINDGTYNLESKMFTLDWIEPEINLDNDTNVAVPQVLFTDATDYDSGSFSETVNSKMLSCDYPSTSDLNGQSKSTTTDSLDMVNGSDYYEGVYVPEVDVNITYASNTYAYLSVVFITQVSETFNVYKVPTHENLVTYIRNFKNDLDSYKGTNSNQFDRIDEEFDNIVALYEYFIELVIFDITTTDGPLNELLDRLNIDRSNYVFQSGPISAFDLAYDFGVNPVTGSGTTGTVPVFTGVRAIGDSIITVVGDVVFINGEVVGTEAIKDRFNTDETISSKGIYVFFGDTTRTWTFDPEIAGKITIISKADVGPPLTRLNLAGSIGFTSFINPGITRTMIWDPVDEEYILC